MLEFLPKWRKFTRLSCSVWHGINIHFRSFLFLRISEIFQEFGFLVPGAEVEISINPIKKLSIFCPRHQGHQQCDQIGRNFATLAKCYNSFAILRVYLIFTKIWTSYRQKIMLTTWPPPRPLADSCISVWKVSIKTQEPILKSAMDCISCGGI